MTLLALSRAVRPFRLALPRFPVIDIETCVFGFHRWAHLPRIPYSERGFARLYSQGSHTSKGSSFNKDKKPETPSQPSFPRFPRTTPTGTQKTESPPQTSKPPSNDKPNRTERYQHSNIVAKETSNPRPQTNRSVVPITKKKNEGKPDYDNKQTSIQMRNAIKPQANTITMKPVAQGNARTQAPVLNMQVDSDSDSDSDFDELSASESEEDSFDGLSDQSDGDDYGNESEEELDDDYESYLDNEDFEQLTGKAEELPPEYTKLYESQKTKENLEALANRERRFLVKEEHRGTRLDKFVLAMCPDISRHQMMKMIRMGRVYMLDDKGAKKIKVRNNARVDLGNTVCVFVSRLQQTSGIRYLKKINNKYKLIPEDIIFMRKMINYIDNNIIILNKPTGLPCQGGPHIRRHIDGLLDALRFPDVDERPRLVHRLDKDTSGALILGRSRKVAAEISEMFRDKHKIKKVYWATVIGRPPKSSGTIKMWLSRGLDIDEKEVVTEVPPDSPNAKLTVTDYKVEAHIGDAISFVSFRPITGHTHQIRVHAATGLKTPILGDYKYGPGHSVELKGNLKENIRLHLHSRFVSLKLDGYKKPVTVTSPMGPHMVKTWRVYGFPYAPPEIIDMASGDNTPKETSQ